MNNNIKSPVGLVISMMKWGLKGGKNG